MLLVVFFYHRAFVLLPQLSYSTNTGCSRASFSCLGLGRHGVPAIDCIKSMAHVSSFQSRVRSLYYLWLYYTRIIGVTFSAARAARACHAWRMLRAVMWISHDKHKCKVSKKNKMASIRCGKNVLVLGVSDSGAINVTLDAPLTVRDIKNRLQCRKVRLFKYNFEWCDDS